MNCFIIPTIMQKNAKFVRQLSSSVHFKGILEKLGVYFWPDFEINGKKKVCIFGFLRSPSFILAMSDPLVHM